MRTLVALPWLLLLASPLAGCHHGGVYEPTPRAVARSMREDFPEADCRRTRGIDLGEGRWEVRGCGRVAVYACTPDARAHCVLERADDVPSAGGEEHVASVGASAEPGLAAPSADRPAVDPVVLADLDRLVLERQESSAVLGISLVVVGPLAVAGGLFGFTYESLRGIRRPFGCWSASGSCSDPPRTLFPDPVVQGLTLGLAGLGAIATVVGSIVLVSDRSRHEGLDGEITEACTRVSVGAAGALTGLTLSTCFP